MIYAFTNILVFLTEFILSVFVYSILLRFFLNCVKSDFYNPVYRIILCITNPVIPLLRRIIPNIFQVHIADLFLAYIMTLVKLFLVSLFYSLTFTVVVDWVNILLAALISLMLMVVNLYIWLVSISSIISWFSSGYRQHPMVVVLQHLTNPLLNIVRKTFPAASSSFDFSPLIVLSVLYCFQIFIVSIEAII